jgi:hypothetical protein
MGGSEDGADVSPVRPDGAVGAFYTPAPQRGGARGDDVVIGVRSSSGEEKGERERAGEPGAHCNAARVGR